MGGSCKTRIAAATPATVCDYQALIGTREVVDLLSCLLVVDDCSHGNLEQDVCAFPASLVGAFAVTSALGFVFRIEAEVNQSVVALAGFHDAVAALAAIAARRPAARTKLLSTKRKTTVAAADIQAGFDARATLANNDRSSGHKLTAKGLESKALRIGVAPISRTA